MLNISNCFCFLFKEMMEIKISSRYYNFAQHTVASAELCTASGRANTTSLIRYCAVKQTRPRCFVRNCFIAMAVL